jgi:predicted acyl esterase
MAAPNIVNVSTITGKTAVQAVGTSATAIVTNSASSGKVFKVNALYISNVDAGGAAAAISATIYRSSTDYHIAQTINVPHNATLDIITKAIYLEEGDSLRLTADTAGDLEAVCSYEEIS